ncbi:MAG TPA: hypothetical protein VE360_05330, partial [Pyrinomonadaceae bacterium]|nr:hypothetical protein [Pyrinomonadaceae bacterium]
MKEAVMKEATAKEVTMKRETMNEAERAGASAFSRRSFLLLPLALYLLPGTARARSWNNYAAPADAWPQFRGNPQ